MKKKKHRKENQLFKFEKCIQIPMQKPYLRYRLPFEVCHSDVGVVVISVHMKGGMH